MKKNSILVLIICFSLPLHAMDDLGSGDDQPKGSDSFDSMGGVLTRSSSVPDGMRSISGDSLDEFLANIDARFAELEARANTALTGVGADPLTDSSLGLPQIPPPGIVPGGFQPVSSALVKAALVNPAIKVPGDPSKVVHYSSPADSSKTIEGGSDSSDDEEQKRRKIVAPFHYDSKALKKAAKFGFGPTLLTDDGQPLSPSGQHRKSLSDSTRGSQSAIFTTAAVDPDEEDPQKSPTSSKKRRTGTKLGHTKQKSGGSRFRLRRATVAEPGAPGAPISVGKSTATKVSGDSSSSKGLLGVKPKRSFIRRVAATLGGGRKRTVRASRATFVERTPAQIAEQEWQAKMSFITMFAKALAAQEDDTKKGPLQFQILSAAKLAKNYAARPDVVAAWAALCKQKASEGSKGEMPEWIQAILYAHKANVAQSPLIPAIVTAFGGGKAAQTETVTDEDLLKLINQAPSKPGGRKAPARPPRRRGGPPPKVPPKNPKGSIDGKSRTGLKRASTKLLPHVDDLDNPPPLLSTALGDLPPLLSTGRPLGVQTGPTDGRPLPSEYTSESSSSEDDDDSSSSDDSDFDG